MADDPLKLEVSLGADGLLVHLPSGRTLPISASEAGAKFLHQMLKDAEAHKHYGTQKRGYIGAFPTQEIAVIWQRQREAQLNMDEQAREFVAAAKERAKEERKERWAAKGIDTSKIRINL